MTKIDERYSHVKGRNPRHTWVIANRFFHTQMLPLLAYLKQTEPTPNNENLIGLYNKTFKKYLITSCVGLIEKYMTLQIRRVIDKQNIDTTIIDLRKKYEKMLSEYPGMTKGECLVVQQDFTNPNVINSIATAILKQDDQFREIKMDFFCAVKKIDWYDPYKYVRGIRGVKPLTENWERFLSMFSLRNKIIHELYDNFIRLNTLASMCDSTMNFIDATDFILSAKFRQDVIDRLSREITLRERNARIDKAMGVAIQKGKVPPAMAKRWYEFISK